MPHQGEPPTPARDGGEWSSHRGGVGRSEEERKWVRIGAWWRRTGLDSLLKGQRGGREAFGPRVGFHGVCFRQREEHRGREVVGQIRKT
jgi:hypothetical protein